MSNRFAERLQNVSNARVALSSLQTTVAPVLNNTALDQLQIVADSLANIETDLRAASDVLDTPPPVETDS